MTDAPFFSVIIPVYNVAPYLRKCLESVVEAAGRLRATCAEAGVEVICVDDGSTDESGKILDNFATELSDGAEKGLVFKVSHQRNGGVSAARNRALDEATGEWLVFVDSDDVVSPELFVFLHRSLAGSSIDMLRFGIVKTETQNVSFGKNEAVVKVFDLEDGSTIKAAAHASLGVSLLWNVCYRRSLVGQTRLAPYQPGEDNLFAVECLVKAKSFAVTSAVLYGYVQHGESCMHAPTAANVSSAINSTLRMNRSLSKWGMARHLGAEIRKEFRGGYCGHVFEQIRKLSGEDRKRVLSEYWRVGREICGIWNWKEPLLGHELLFIVFVYCPWRVKVALFRNPLTRRFITLLRGGSRA